MNHPSPEAIRKAMDLLESVASPGDLVNMNQIDISRHGCTTVACHGGWYALAKISTDEIDWRRKEEGNITEETACLRTWPIIYDKGANLLARDLGFDNYGELASWAFRNSPLWGNSQGAMMFAGGPSGREAFGINSTEEYTFGVDAIIAHWRAVADRIEAAQKLDDVYAHAVLDDAQ